MANWGATSVARRNIKRGLIPSIQARSPAICQRFKVRGVEHRKLQRQLKKLPKNSKEYQALKKKLSESALMVDYIEDIGEIDPVDAGHAQNLCGGTTGYWYVFFATGGGVVSEHGFQNTHMRSADLYNEMINHPYYNGEWGGLGKGKGNATHSDKLTLHQCQALSCIGVFTAFAAGDEIEFMRRYVSFFDLVAF